uniref:phosphatidylinositol N-acetylglucosaminyltransferase n=1 Tax=Chromera velia CCMP2878 TaxID=1169474 RepID=A0A0G4HPE0_9ALVE|eukprot:Cvel_29805.t1-p1 / transcript=Cvel_29805.t1 / gene=Cvel_29805 / organism=Chromera_velia_CCMP2878 / gene_product=Phosphatidylinositol, putative / transcript_product=Phosphatidylinositol, putative / location=Cvel_scaffold4147:6025-9373(-) / protein_length=533 / sequence_SO=supercontig / SO=protein_coding / is_pseudo=false
MMDNGGSLETLMEEKGEETEECFQNEIPQRRPIRICMVSDFFFPGLGGVEMHIYSLAQCLLQMGYKVIVVTHFRGERHGVRYMTGGLKVYYLPFHPFHDNCTLPTIFSFFPLIRKILIRERIDIVHGHQATSNLAHETIFHARTMGYKVLYTDHSLFGFADAACIHINKLLKFFLSDIDHAICVSHTNKENLVLRAALRPTNVSVIPNAVDATRFIPDVSRRPPPPRLNVIILARLTYRKGVDLLVDVIPHVCRREPNVHFIIGGDGPKRILLEEMRERHRLHDRMELLGAVPHANVCSVLQRGHIFLNASLTEAFCIAIVEAAACGLLVVTTAVGGVPEVLPSEMVRLAEPSWQSLTEEVVGAVRQVVEGQVEADRFHQRVAEIYSWQDVARRTEEVYRKVWAAPRLGILEHFSRFLSSGPFSGLLFAIFAALDFFFWSVLEWLQPREDIEIAPDFPLESWALEEKEKEAEDREFHQQVVQQQRRRRETLERSMGGEQPEEGVSEPSTAEEAPVAASHSTEKGRETIPIDDR